jgi:DNA-binding transcriptional LysR family regulator
MELRHLRYFMAVAETGHITRAAARLGIQQPPLSQQIRALESELGVAVFLRHPKGVTLTTAGEALRLDAQRVLDAVDALEQRIRRLVAGSGGTVAVGFTSSAAAHEFAPRVLRDCRRLYPDIELSISEDNAAGVTEAVADGRLQCGFLRVPVARPEGIAFETLLTESAVLAVPVDHRIADDYGRHDRVPFEALEGERLVLVRRSGAPGLYADLLGVLERLGVGVLIAAEVERMMTNINMVAAGGGITVVPASMQGAHPRAIAYRRLPADPALLAPITLVWRPAGASPTTVSFVALARRIAGARPGRRSRGAGG